MFKSQKKKKEELFANYSKVKKGSFYFNSIKQFFLKSDKTAIFQVISDKTYQDLDLDEVFMFVDRTLSKVGQQFLYNAFRTIPQNPDRVERLEDLIKILNGRKELKEDVLFELSKLGNSDAYYISSLFLEDYFPKPKWFLIVPILSLVSVVSLVSSLLFPQFLLVLIPVLAINFLIHYWNREKFVQYSSSILQLLILNGIAKEFLKARILAERNEEIAESIKSIESIGMQMSIFKLEAKFQSDVGQAVESITDIVKALFLVEPLVFFSVLKKLDSKRNEIRKLYTLVGEIDTAISIDSLRKELPYCAVPVITGNKKVLSATDIYHPLLLDPVSNSIEIQHKSVLLTGSNMSGKTTFIRTFGINAILAQTLNICFAREFVLPRLKVHSAIRISDDLMNGKSYYFEEVLTIKSMLEESRSGVQNLFLLDEMFKGTNTVERIAAGKSVLSFLNQKDNVVFISTHDLELAEYLTAGYSLYHFTEIVENEKILFDFKLKAGQLKTTNAIRILELNSYPAEIIEEAINLSDQLIKNKTFVNPI